MAEKMPDYICNVVAAQRGKKMMNDVLHDDGLHDTYFLRKLYFEQIKQHAEAMRAPHFKDDHTYLKMRQRGELFGNTEIGTAIRKYQSKKEETGPEAKTVPRIATMKSNLESTLINGDYSANTIQPNSNYARIMTGFDPKATPYLEKSMRSYQSDNHPYKPSPSVYFFG